MVAAHFGNSVADYSLTAFAADKFAAVDRAAVGTALAPVDLLAAAFETALVAAANQTNFAAEIAARSDFVTVAQAFPLNFGTVEWSAFAAMEIAVAADSSENTVVCVSLAATADSVHIVAASVDFGDIVATVAE